MPAPSLFSISQDTPQLDLLDAASMRLEAVRNLLALLAGAESLGTPASEVLSGSLTSLELLLADVSCLYSAAFERYQQQPG